MATVRKNRDPSEQAMNETEVFVVENDSAVVRRWHMTINTIEL
jgi:hypothetical protein